ncbi:MAG TPA: hypothetical protein VFE50_17760 [Cyclobacteriaceae bacterium]|nr:hypothetical protein [Cyclobacteriaceae bacterium]
MKNFKMIVTAAAVAIAMLGAVATSHAKKNFFSSAYVWVSSTSCQLTTKPAICNTIDVPFCVVGGSRFFQSMVQNPRYVCVNEYRMP